MNNPAAKENGIIEGTELAFSVDGLVAIACTSIGIEFYYIGLTLIAKYDHYDEKLKQYNIAVDKWIEYRNYAKRNIETIIK